MGVPRFFVLSQSTLERDFWRENCRKQAYAARVTDAAAMPWGTCERSRRRRDAVLARLRMNGGAAVSTSQNRRAKTGALLQLS
jgi:hypothetical protein